MKLFCGQFCLVQRVNKYIFILFYLLGIETDKYYTNTSLANADLDAQAALIYANIFHKGFCDH